MKILFLLTIALSLLFGGCSDLKEYIIDLNLPPHDRYIEIIKDFKEPILAMHDHFMENLDPFLKTEISKHYSIIKTNYGEYMSEIEGMAKLLNLSKESLFTLNLYFETIIACTSIIGREENGDLLHMRNFDFGDQEFFSKITYSGIYLHGSSYYKCIGTAGFVGQKTCMRPYQFSISANARFITWDPRDNLKYLEKGYMPSIWEIRRSVEQSDDFKQIKQYWLHALVVFPGYVIITGINQQRNSENNDGCVITRASETVDDVVCLSDDPEMWYIVKTNSDRDEESECPRYQTAVKALENLGQRNLNLQSFENVVNIPPVKHEGTIYRSSMCPANGYFQTFLYDF
jgi:hypothetical protein